MLLTSSISKAMSILCSGIRVLVTEVETSLGSSTRLFVVLSVIGLNKLMPELPTWLEINERTLKLVVACT